MKIVSTLFLLILTSALSFADVTTNPNITGIPISGLPIATFTDYTSTDRVTDAEFSNYTAIDRVTDIKFSGYTSTNRVVEGSDFGFGNITGNSINATIGLFDNVSTNVLRTRSLTVSGGVAFTGQTTVYNTFSAPASVYTVFGNSTTGPYSITLPDTTTISRGHRIVIKKIDASQNVITIDGFGVQTIDHKLTKIIHYHNNALTVESDGVGWEIVQATAISFYGDMHIHDNISSTVINTQNSPHAVRKFSDEGSLGMAFNAGSTGPISQFSDWGVIIEDTTAVKDVGHGLLTGDIVTINGTTSYNGIFEITVISDDDYYISVVFVADDATGDWVKGDYYVFDAGTAGKYMITFHGFGKPDVGVNQDYEFSVFKNTAEQPNVEAKRRFANSNDTGTFGGGGLVNIADNDRISFIITSLSGTQNITLEHLNVSLIFIQ